MKTMRRILAALMIFAAALALFPDFAAWFSRRVSAPALEIIGRLSARVSFPLVGLLIIAFIVTACLVRPRFFAAVLTLSVLYCALWLPVEMTRAETIPKADPERLSLLCDELVARLNETGRVQTDAESALRIAGEAMGVSSPAKAARYPEWMRTLKLAGVYIPFTGEAIIDTSRPAAGLIFTAAHELAHAGGVGSESWANVAAYEACVRRGGAAEYSANLWALRYALRGGGAPVNLDPGIARDLMDIPYSGNINGDYAYLADWLCTR